MRGMLNTVVI